MTLLSRLNSVIQNVQKFDKLLQCDQTSWEFLGVILVMNESVFQRSMTRYMYGLWSKFRTFLIVIGHKNPMKNVVRLFSWSPCCQTKSLKSADQRVELVGGKWEHWTWIDSIHWKAFVLRPWNTSERAKRNERVACNPRNSCICLLVSRVHLYPLWIKTNCIQANCWNLY